MYKPYFLWGCCAGISSFLFPGSIFFAFIATDRFLHLLVGSSSRKLWQKASCFLFGYHLTALHWAVFALVDDISVFWWFVPFAIIGLPLVLTTIIQIGLGWVSLFLGKPGYVRFGALIFWWVGGEWLRSWVLTGFPWALLGYSWSECLPVCQWVQWIGVYGLSALTLTVGACRYIWKLSYGRYLVFLLVVIGAALYGMGRQLMQPYTLPCSIKIVQPSVPQKEKWDARKIYEHFDRLCSMSIEGNSVDLLVWPESVVSFYLDNDKKAREAIRKFLYKTRFLIAGSDRVSNDNIYNSLFVLDRNASVTARYDKIHLVPFGEFIPGRYFFNALGMNVSSLTAGIGDYTPGHSRSLLSIPGVGNILPLICYESIFFSEINSAGATFIVNITNDSWFDYTVAPMQHFAMARMRAIEHRKPLIRAANTGVSAVVDPYGRIIASLPLRVEGVLDVGVK